jgi:hypothetical protein
VTVSVRLKVFAETPADIRPVYELLDEVVNRLADGAHTAYPGLIAASLQITHELEGGLPE